MNRIESNLMPLISVCKTLARTTLGEETIGKKVKREIKREINGVLSIPKFKSDNEKIRIPFMNKLTETRPRMIGALSVYSALSGIPYSEISTNQGIECFYIFWRIADGQDDLIDSPKEQKEQNEQIPLIQKIFQGEGEFFKGTLHLLENKITQGNIGEKEKKYLKEKIAGWYRFLTIQETEIESKNFNSFDFDYSKKYRQEQNQKAGEVLVALLNWRECLNPNYKKLEEIIPQFSIYTQMVDDIGDTVEDIESRRPSFSVGALISHPEEMTRFLKEIKKRGIKKVHPKFLQQIAPQSSELLNAYFKEHCDFLESKTGQAGKGFNAIASFIYSHFPTARDFLFKLNPNVANF